MMAITATLAFFSTPSSSPNQNAEATKLGAGFCKFRRKETRFFRFSASYNININGTLVGLPMENVNIDEDFVNHMRRKVVLESPPKRGSCISCVMLYNLMRCYNPLENHVR